MSNIARPDINPHNRLPLVSRRFAVKTIPFIGAALARMISTRRALAQEPPLPGPMPPAGSTAENIPSSEGWTLFASVEAGKIIEGAAITDLIPNIPSDGSLLKISYDVSLETQWSQTGGVFVRSNSPEDPTKSRTLAFIKYNGGVSRQQLIVSYRDNQPFPQVFNLPSTEKFRQTGRMVLARNQIQVQVTEGDVQSFTLARNFYEDGDNITAGTATNNNDKLTINQFQVEVKAQEAGTLPDLTASAEDETPKPAETPRDWQLFAQASFEKSNYDSMNPAAVRGEIKDLIPDIPFDGKEVAMDANVWSDNNQKGVAERIAVTGFKPENQWRLSVSFGAQKVGILKPLSLWGQEINTRFELKDGSTLSYRTQSGETFEVSFKDEAGNQLDFFQADGPLTAGVSVNAHSHINAKNVAVYTRDRVATLQ
ncbi:hypothetical protein HYS97_01610 [Candidatus Daviesbacteria bacterium]|nr:hypothetical protein [Candidatus Daviesbacteria bacterium]